MPSLSKSVVWYMRRTAFLESEREELCSPETRPVALHATLTEINAKDVPE